MEVQICDVPDPGFDALQCDIKKKISEKEKINLYMGD